MFNSSRRLQCPVLPDSIVETNALKKILKTIFHPLARRTLSLAEPLAGFWTDPTGYIPNRLNMLAGNYENFLIESICRALPEPGVFVDIGANVGFISRQVARRFPRVRTLAFEPNPRIFPVLEKNLRPFSRCEAFHTGLGAKEGILEFFHGDESCVGSFVKEYTRQHPGNSSSRQLATVNVPVTTGDAALAHVGKIDVMKMDVEGYETEVLKGMPKLLAAGSVKTIFFEFCPFAQKFADQHPEKIIRLLLESGYAVSEVEDENKGARVDAENIGALIEKLGERGYTTLQAQL